jgi:hypothetical protein
VNDDDSFALDGITGKVILRPFGMPPQWTLKAVMAGAKDITDTGADAASLGGDMRIRVVLTDKIAEVSGSVMNARREPVVDYVVVLLPQSAVERSSRTARPDQSGSFRIGGLPQGRYVAVAVDSLRQGSEFDPEFQKTVRAAGQSFTLRQGEAATLTLTLLP